MEDRIPPQDNAAEMAVLGSMLLSKDAIADVVDAMDSADHHAPKHELIHDAIMEVDASGEPVDVRVLVDYCIRRGILGKVGGHEYLLSLVSDHNLVPANAGYYAGIVRKNAVLRRLIDAGTRITQRAYSGEGELDDVLDWAQAEVLAAVPQNDADEYRIISDTMAETLDAIEATADREGVTGVPTGFLDLDELLGGLHGGQMIVIAGRPAMGKSTLAVDICRAAAIRNQMASCIFSLEMTRRELTTRVIAAEAKVRLHNLHNADNLTDADWARIASAMSQIGAAPLFIDDSPHVNMTEIRAKAHRLKREHDLRLIVIDYMQLMTSGKRVENRQTEVSEFSRQIKLLAKEIGVPVVALSQLNRGPEQRTNKRPMLSDLRESGSIEQDADIVILVHRDDMYDKESTRPGEADLIVAKHRNGPTQDVTVAFQGHYSRFVDMAQPGWGYS